MTQLVQGPFILLAAREELHRVWGRFDNERPGINFNHLAIAIAMIATAFVATIIWRHRKRRSAMIYSADSPTKLFRDLCAAHGLSRSSRRLLKQLAETRGATDPATVFVEPGYFELQQLSPELKASAKELRLLNETLFG